MPEISLFYGIKISMNWCEHNPPHFYAYKGTFHMRISPELHRNIAVYVIGHGKSLNAAVEEAIGNMVGA